MRFKIVASFFLEEKKRTRIEIFIQHLLGSFKSFVICRKWKKEAVILIQHHLSPLIKCFSTLFHSFFPFCDFFCSSEATSNKSTIPCLQSNRSRRRDRERKNNSSRKQHQQRAKCLIRINLLLFSQ